MTASGRYIFCDIDGTLLYARGSGRIAFGEAFKQAYDVTVDMSAINFAGATDIGVVERLARENNIQLVAERTQHLFKLLPELLGENMVHSPPKVFPGVVHFLERVSKDWTLGLVTGNIRACAYLKLKHGGLADYFSDVGGFGDDDGNRKKMAAIALSRAGNPEGSVLLGDTPSDIEAAHANNMLSIAVCNGQFSRQELEAEHPDVIVDSFEDAEHLFHVLTV